MPSPRTRSHAVTLAFVLNSAAAAGIARTAPAGSGPKRGVNFTIAWQAPAVSLPLAQRDPGSRGHEDS